KQSEVLELETNTNKSNHMYVTLKVPNEKKVKIVIKNINQMYVDYKVSKDKMVIFEGIEYKEFEEVVKGEISDHELLNRIATNLVVEFNTMSVYLYSTKLIIEIIKLY
ncbi:MAG: hypothetical protein ACRC6X_05110, partial [Culicoidibacterales bacterium]